MPTATATATPRTALVRRLDLGRPSNRFALLATAATLLIAAVVHTTVGTGGATAGLRDAAGVFLAWALGRELDPDRPRTARYATVLAVVLLPLGHPAVLPLLALLAATRVVTRTVGAPRPVDLLALPVLAGVAAGSAVAVVPALAVAAALYLDTRFADAAERGTALAAFGALAAAVIAATVGGVLGASWDSPRLLEGAVFLAGLVAAAQLRPAPPRARADATGEPLDAGRLRAARLLVVVTAALAVAWAGGIAVPALGPAWSAVLATALVETVSSRARAAPPGPPRTRRLSRAGTATS